MLSAAQLAKENGNIAFKKKDYELARTYYEEAMQIDTTDYLYPLNRSMANLKLRRWSEAERDASIALQLAPGNLKAYYRRITARIEQGDFAGARKDNEAFLHAGGSLEDSERATAQIAVAESYLGSRVNGPNFPSTTGAAADGALPISYGYVVAEAGEKGLGAFAIQDFHRGDLILTDPPLFLVDEPNHSRKVTLRNIMIAVQKLSHAEKRAFVSLKNAHSGSKLVDNPIIGIYYTNAFEAGNRSAICVAASRFNHSCLPNARYSWHAASGRMRIYALREIAIGEEIFVSYLSGRRVYGSCHKDRQKELKRYIFTCACIACSLPSLEQAASDARRKEIARIWDSVPLYMPHQTADRLTAIIRAIRLLEEEGYPADADDFTNDAAAICACHGDWESVRYWATKTYETRVAEFGEDSHRAAEVKNSYLDLKKSPHAETQRKQIFTARL